MKKILCVCYILLVAFSFLHSQELTIQNLLSSPFPTNLVKSVDGKHIAWVFNQEGIRNIYTASAPDFDPQKVTSYSVDNGQSISQLKFSKDNTKLLYVYGDGSNRFGKSPNPTSDPKWAKQNILLIELDQGIVIPIAEGTNPSFNPKGTQVVFTKSGMAYYYNLNTKISAPIFTIRGNVGELKYSPDGNYIAFTSNRGTHSFVGIYDIIDSTLNYVAPSVDRDGSIVWSPSSNQLAFLRTYRNRSSLPFFEQRTGMGWGIMHYDIESKKSKQLWKTPAGYGSVFRSITADNQILWGAGDHLVFPYEGDGWTHLYSLHIDEEMPKLITPGDFEVQYAALSHDKYSVLYSSNQGDVDRQHIWQMDIKGGTPIQLSNGRGVEWSPLSLENSRVFALASTGTIPAHVAKIEYSNVKNIAEDLVPKLFQTNNLQAPEQVVFDSGGDLKIHGQLFRPKTMVKGKKYPTVMFFHGGSRRQMLLGFHHRGYYHNAFALNQFLANQGYLVLSVNYRSGIGYGLEFREALNYGANGASEYKDVLAAAEYLKNREDVDTSKIGLWGGSYGGYLTALGLARNSDLFAAGVDIHGVHDWNVVIKNFVPNYESDRQPWIEKLAKESSPMHYLDGWKSPVLLIHGDDDRNVPFSETVDIVEELRKRNVYFEQLIFPDEVHGFLLHQNWVSAYKATFDFFERKLK